MREQLWISSFIYIGLEIDRSGLSDLSAVSVYETVAGSDQVYKCFQFECETVSTCCMMLCATGAMFMPILSGLPLTSNSSSNEMLSANRAI